MARILRIHAVEDKTGWKRSKIYAEIAAGNFPKQIKLGPRSVGWDEAEVDAHVAKVIEQARSPQ